METGKLLKNGQHCPNTLQTSRDLENHLLRNRVFSLLSWGCPTLNKTLTIPVKNTPVFRDPFERHLEALSKSLFSPAGHALQPAVAMMPDCQTLGWWDKFILKRLNFIHTGPSFVEHSVLMQTALNYCVDRLVNIARISLLLVNMGTTLWFKCLSVQQHQNRLPCLTYVVFHISVPHSLPLPAHTY